MPKPPFQINVRSGISDTCAFEVADATGTPVVGIVGWSMHPEEGICPTSQRIAVIVRDALNKAGVIDE